MTSLEKIYELIPHRPPFLWLDRIIELNSERIVAEKDIPLELDIFSGHYPDHPIMPGVILCEAVFQAGAALISKKMINQPHASSRIPVLTRIVGAKFKREVRPGETIVIEASLKENVGPAWFMKGTITVGGKVAVKVEFACAMT
ncbi:MAG: 3-hydroxyacyl-ACP dehydratase FabZ [Proteobacteria bacterium]|nr:3-hydroxyacyl-ACP dehydratase FabZ [Pseudomonadota bacterium]MBU1714117.1 3-hydroxyacyl-ACP dehydratase FabZ [Pseudomonadota bacterium]